MTHPDLHLVRTRPPVLDVPPLVYVEAPVPPEPPRPHPMAEWLYGERPPPPPPQRPPVASWALLGAIAAVLAGSAALALSGGPCLLVVARRCLVARYRAPAARGRRNGDGPQRGQQAWVEQLSLSFN